MKLDTMRRDKMKLERTSDEDLWRPRTRKPIRHHHSIFRSLQIRYIALPPPNLLVTGPLSS
jgi:hypothetical protein